MRSRRYCLPLSATKRGKGGPKRSCKGSAKSLLQPPPVSFQHRKRDHDSLTARQACSRKPRARRVHCTLSWPPARHGRARPAATWAQRAQPALGTSTRQAVLEGRLPPQPPAGASCVLRHFRLRAHAPSNPHTCLQEALRTFGGSQGQGRPGLSPPACRACLLRGINLRARATAGT